MSIEVSEDVCIVAKLGLQTEKPKDYHVWLYNDDYTPMEFVVDIVETVFHADSATAKKVMLEVHHKGKAICGTYHVTLAQALASEVMQLSQEEGFPLLCEAKKV
jgi:ATP-dependent Clp protease adaptor protein ClpS